MAKLMRYGDAEYIREATPEEQRASILKAAQDGGAGVIVLTDGTRAYVETEAADVERLSAWLEGEEDERLYSALHDRYDTALRLPGPR